ncbi:MAG: hypothetical protein NC834_02625 [Candidatus Omnitrophica bacterium]|nr:hypothetical protein [Candidatus Omnitrophota bacterium]
MNKTLKRKKEASAIYFSGAGSSGGINREEAGKMAIFLKKGNWYIDYYVQGKRKREKIGPVRGAGGDSAEEKKGGDCREEIFGY